MCLDWYSEIFMMPNVRGTDIHTTHPMIKLVFNFHNSQNLSTFISSLPKKRKKLISGEDKNQNMS